MIRVLVVDDDYRVADLHCAYVERVAGFEVAGRAHSGGAALASVDQLQPDLVLLDIYLPDMTGLEVLRRLREDDHPPVDVIAITAAHDVDSLRSAMQGGVVHYLVKPFRFSAFQEKLQSYAALRNRMARLSEADQRDVDGLYGLLHNGANSEELPKGLAVPTLELVARVLDESREDLTATDVGRRAGVSRVTARRYLDHLCRLGRVELAMRYGTPGRPEHLYRVRASRDR